MPRGTPAWRPASPLTLMPDHQPIYFGYACPCGSGEPKEAQYDARGIFLCYACDKCSRVKLSKFRQDVLDDPNYWTDEPIEAEE